MDMRKRIAVIPAYEPDEKMIPLLREAKENGFTLVVVDDGSGESFSSIFEMARQYAHVISYTPNQGKGHALKTAFSYLLDQNTIESTIIVLDCDGQHRVCDAKMLCEESERAGEGLFLGSRPQSGASPLRSRFGNAVTRNVFHVVSGIKIYDTQTGMRAFDAQLLPMMMKIPGERYEYEMNMLLQLAEWKIPIREMTIATIYMENNAGSHFHTLRDSWLIYKEIVKFSLSSLLAFVIDYLLFSLITFAAKGAAPLLSNVCARIVSASVNYNVNRRLVFDDHGPVQKSALEYFSLAAGILVCNSAILWALTTYAGMNPYLAKIVTEVCLMTVSYLVQKKIIFHVKTNPPERTVKPYESFYKKQKI